MTTSESVRELVAGFLPTQRWFAGKGRDFDVEVHRLAELLHSPQVTLWTAQVSYHDGDAGEVETYQLPLVARAEPVATLEHVLLGTIDVDDLGTRWVYDALHDKDVTPAWLSGIQTAPDDGSTGTGTVRFARYAPAETIPVDDASLVLSGEQSNTSMIFGDTAIMKFFRRLQPGVNPDIEVQAALSRLGAANIARMLGSIETDVDGVASSLAFLQEFMSSATDGWVLATTSVRDLMAEADLHADEAGGDFAGEAERLGAAVARTHADLATAFGTREATTDDLTARSAAMLDRLRAALPIVPQLADIAEPLGDLFRDIAGLAGTGEPVMLQRIHGDLHLGQVLRTVYRWVLIDFEGEPMAAIDARRTQDFALRDIAGMLRSFEYAGYHRVVEFGNDPQLTYRAAEWAARNRNAFCVGYAEAAGADPRSYELLLRAFEADKAVYEAVYEARNRPSWVPIPLVSLTRLAHDEGHSR